MNDQHSLEHRPLSTNVYICVHNSTMRMRSLPTGVPDPMVSMWDAYRPKILKNSVYKF